ncbi:MAG: hypothetical protein KF696_02850 [Planctomycetes bacterium]|nr:hypothetical protein [Planctomycetota bacterium]MCW8134943.1 hypothetical protein [Planctomycetota bacterium]
MTWFLGSATLLFCGALIFAVSFEVKQSGAGLVLGVIGVTFLLVAAFLGWVGFSHRLLVYSDSVVEARPLSGIKIDRQSSERWQLGSVSAYSSSGGMSDSWQHAECFNAAGKSLDSVCLKNLTRIFGEPA